eukprot:SM000449S16316  [mRNA]  locus=s449:10947:12657:+ [translate_table: standard]
MKPSRQPRPLRQLPRECPASGCEKVSIVGHSAGGWLARLYMVEFGTDDVALLVTLGTPHLPPPRGVPGVIDQTRGLLYHIDEYCPGAYHPEVKYVCVAGRYLRGHPFFGPKLLDASATATGVAASLVEEDIVAVAATGVGPAVATAEMDESDVGGSVGGNGGLLKADEAGAARTTAGGVEVMLQGGERKLVPPSLQTRVVGQGYKQVCGKVDVWGDGVVPVEAAHLEGALNICIDGVFHSPVGANGGDRPWYGSEGILTKWVHYLLE